MVSSKLLKDSSQVISILNQELSVKKLESYFGQAEVRLKMKASWTASLVWPWSGPQNPQMFLRVQCVVSEEEVSLGHKKELDVNTVRNSLHSGCRQSQQELAGCVWTWNGPSVKQDTKSSGDGDDRIAGVSGQERSTTCVNTQETVKQKRANSYISLTSRFHF